MAEYIDSLLPDGPCRVTEHAGLRAATLRLYRPSVQQIRAIEEISGISLPVEPNTVTGEALQVLWCAPGEWLFTGEVTREILARVEASAQMPHHVADMSGAYAVFELAGPSARDVLAKLCSLDFHPRVFGPGRCAQSLFAQVRGLIQQLDAQPSFRLFVDRSHRHHMRQCLTVANIAADHRIESAEPRC